MDTRMQMIWVSLLVAHGYMYTSGASSSAACPEMCKCTDHMKHVYCDNKKLRGIPDIPETVEWLYLGNNLLTKILPNAFIQLKNLTILALNQNQIVDIYDDSFAGLSKLESLHLTNNHIRELDAEAFKGLSKLTKLYLTDNLLEQIPDIRHLISLKRLNIDTNKFEEARFPDGFTNLKSLSGLIMANNPVTVIKKTDLDPVRLLPITNIDLSRCDLKKIENRSFTDFPRLTSVSLGYTKLKSDNLKHVIDGFAGSKIISLDLSGAIKETLPSDAFSGLEDVPLRDLFLRHSSLTVIRNRTFDHLSHLNLLDLDYCDINVIEKDAFFGLINLINLTLAHNDLKILEPFNIPSLTTLDLSYNKNLDDLPNDPFIYLQNLIRLDISNCAIKTIGKTPFSGIELLQFLDLSGNKIGGTAISVSVFTNMNKLERLDLHNNNMGNLGNESDLFVGLDSLVELDLSENQCRLLSKNIFDPLKSLKKLNLSTNALGRLIGGDEGIYFKNLASLEVVDLSQQQSLAVLPGMLFKGSPNLKKILLTRNDISSWGSSFFNQSSKLEYVDLSVNQIALIKMDSGIDKLPHNATLNLLGNPFNCFCDLVWFRNWMNSTTVKFINLKEYKCSSPQNMKDKHLLSFNPTTIAAECKPLPWLMILLVCLGSFLALVLLTFSLLYRYRWPIRLWWYGAKKHLHKNRALRAYDRLDEENNDEETHYDAFISVSTNREDEDWVRRELLHRMDNGMAFPEDEREDMEFIGRFKLCHEPVHLAGLGRSLLSLIAEAIQLSKKVILVVSENYLRNRQKTDFELQLAMQKALERGQNTVILVLLDPNIGVKLPHELHVMMRKHEELEWTPNDPAGQELFWTRLEEKLNAAPDANINV